MEETVLLYTILTILFLLLTLKLLTTKKQWKNNLPPSPPSFPIIGHLHLLKQPIQRTLENLSKKCGPIISLRFGSRQVILVSSPSAVEECFTKSNDRILANRPHFLMGKYSNYNNTTLVTANYGDHWRNLRRISAVEIFSSTRLNKFENVRKDEVNSLLRKIYKISSCGFAKVNLRSMFFDLTVNIMMRMIAGKRCEEDEETGLKIREIVVEFFGYTEMTHVGDLFPSFEWFDYNGFIKKIIRFSGKLDLFLQGLIDEHRVDQDRNSMINHLLALQELQPDYYSDEIIKGLVLVMLVGGIDTTAVALEWAITNLLNNSNVLKKAYDEINDKIGEERLINESDLTELKYLQSIIYENLRLCPVAPLLIPHVASNDCTVGGFHVPANSMVIVNMWEIQRDPNLWDDPTCFKPERFENGKVDGFKLLPFGFGRRSCPGEGLANKEMGLALGSLIQCFEWERIGGKEIDMTEKTTATMSKVEPLEVLCKARPILHELLS